VYEQLPVSKCGDRWVGPRPGGRGQRGTLRGRERGGTINRCTIRKEGDRKMEEQRGEPGK